MTKGEITNKQNIYKTELNECNTHIENYNQSISAFSTLKKIINNGKNKVLKLQKGTLVSALTCTILGILGSFFLSPAYVILVFGSAFFIERFIYFKKIGKKFERSSNCLAKIVNGLTLKKEAYLYKKETALAAIIQLENEIPDVVSFVEEDLKEENLTTNFEEEVLSL